MAESPDTIPSFNPTLPPPFPLYDVAGTHYDCGFQHGEQASEHIHMHLESMVDSLGLSRDTIRQRALGFRPLFEKHCPHLCEEIQGLAEGARIKLADAYAVNIRGALNFTSDGGCTAFAVQGRGTASGNPLIGQNSDMLPTVIDQAYVLRIRPVGKPACLIWTFGGMIGYHGINDQGIAQFANDIGGGPAPRFGFPHYPLKRLMLERTLVSELVTLVQSTPLWINGNYVVSDKDGHILDLEATPEHVEMVTDQGRGFLAHANHFLSARYATGNNFRQSVIDSFMRQYRMDHLLRSKFGQLDLQMMKDQMRTSGGSPTGICRQARSSDLSQGWETAGITVASIIAEPTQGQLHIAPGNHPESRFTRYSFAG